MKSKLWHYLAAPLLALAILAGCTTPTPQQAAANPQAAVFAAKGGYEAALTVAVAYAQLPRCIAGAKLVLCSEQAVVDQVVRAHGVARDALASAEGAVRTPGFGNNVPATAIAAAQAAVDAMKAITTTLKVR